VRTIIWTGKEEEMEEEVEEEDEVEMEVEDDSVASMVRNPSPSVGAPRKPSRQGR
jgi:hypothetical protein